LGETDLPNLGDPNRVTALKKLAQDFLTEATLEQVKKLETEHAAALGSMDKLRDYIVNLEEAMWKRAGPANFPRFARERILMLASKANQGLKNALLDGSITIQGFVDSKTEDLESEEAKARIEEGSRWALAAAQSDFYLKNVTVSEGEFTCSKCKSRKIASFQKQMRSADEPMTT
jgi:DNA-directed RNA polymerase subunit M/transcription elongation factor TFIIS